MDNIKQQIISSAANHLISLINSEVPTDEFIIELTVTKERYEIRILTIKPEEHPEPTLMGTEGEA